MKWVNKGHEFDEVAEEVIKDNVQYYLWGAGIRGESFYKSFKDELKINGFLDNNYKKQTSLFCGLPVVSPISILSSSNKPKIIITSIWRKEISIELSDYGYIENRDFFFSEEFSSTYQMYKYNKLYLPVLHYMPTQKCSLKCKHCALMIPRLAKPITHDVPYMLQDIDKLMQIVDYISLLCITGGDTFMHPRLDEFFAEIASKYHKTKIGSFQILTNAIILPSEDRLELFKKYDAQIRFTDYGELTNGKQKITQMIELLEKYQVSYQCSSFDSWLDLGYPQESNGITSNQELSNFFSSCNNTCQLYSDEKIYYCANAKLADDLGYCKCKKGDYLDLSEPNLKKAEIMEYMLGYSSRGFVELCKKCNGLFEINENKVIAGEQL